MVKKKIVFGQTPSFYARVLGYSAYPSKYAQKG